MISGTTVKVVIIGTMMLSMVTFTGYTAMESKYPGHGLEVIKNALKDTMSFEDAIKLLKDGKKIRRKGERKGYAKITSIIGNQKTEKYGTLWIDGSRLSDSAYFTIEEVFADDWIVDEDD